MEYRTLGNSGLKVSRLGFGLMTLRDVNQSVELISRARDAGINYFDNAEAYGNPRGTAETLFGKAYKILLARDPLKYKRSNMVITTKIFFGPSGDPSQAPSLDRSLFTENELGTSRKHIIEGVNASLQRTQLSYVDVVYAHRYDNITPIIEVVRAFTDIIKSGKAFYWGTSQWPVTKIIEAYWIAEKYNLIKPIVEQPQYSMFSRVFLEDHYLDVFNKKYNIATTIWGALDSGILTGKYLNGIGEGTRFHKTDPLHVFQSKIPQWKHKKVRQLQEIARRLNTNTTNLALAWALKNNNVTVILLGAKHASQLDTTLKCMDVAKKLNDNVMKEIETILDNKPIRHRFLYDKHGRYHKNFRRSRL